MLINYIWIASSKVNLPNGGDFGGRKVTGLRLPQKSDRHQPTYKKGVTALPRGKLDRQPHLEENMANSVSPQECSVTYVRPKSHKKREERV